MQLLTNPALFLHPGVESRIAVDLSQFIGILVANSSVEAMEMVMADGRRERIGGDIAMYFPKEECTDQAIVFRLATRYPEESVPLVVLGIEPTDHAFVGRVM